MAPDVGCENLEAMAPEWEREAAACEAAACEAAALEWGEQRRPMRCATRHSRARQWHPCRGDGARKWTRGFAAMALGVRREVAAPEGCEEGSEASPSEWGRMACCSCSSRDALACCCCCCCNSEQANSADSFECCQHQQRRRQVWEGKLSGWAALVLLESSSNMDARRRRSSTNN